MRPRSGARRATSLGVAGLAGAAALVSALGAAPATAAQARLASATAGQHLFQTPQQASAQAIRTGRKVAVTGSTTPDSTLTANPNGTFTLTESTAPVRAKVGGRWRNLDASLVRNSDGTYSPTVSSQPLALSGGGSGPLATMTDGTYSLALTAPMQLPAPVITGNTASYDSVLPGVDLIVTAQPSGGFSEVLRIATAKAAANPALQALTFTTTTKGVTLKTAGNGAIAAVTRSGQAIFSAPASQMWDSATAPSPAPPSQPAIQPGRPAGLPPAATTGQPAASTAGGPGPGAHTGPLEVRVAGGRITLAPDRQLLTGAGVVYPEYLDPNWDAAGSAASSWAYVSQQYPGQQYYDTDMTLQVGQDPDATSYTSYSFYTLPLPSQVDGAVIDTAYAYFPEVWADSCTASPVQLWLTGTISGNTTWNNQPAWDSELGSDDVAYGWSPSDDPGGAPPSGDPGCGDNDVPYTITSTVATAAADSWPTVTVGLRASDTSDPTGWKQFADPDSSPSGNATLSTTYADTPATPALSTSPAANCAAGTSVLGNGNVALDAAASDVNGTATGNLTVTYNAYADGNTADTFASNPTMSVSAASGTTATLLLSAADLNSAVTNYGSNPANPADPNDQVTITWTATVSDGLSGVPSSPTASCTFIFSTAQPGAPQIFDSAGNPGCNTQTYIAGTQYNLTLKPNGTSIAATEPTSYIYQLNGGNPVTVPAATSSPYSATISITPTGFTNTLTVEAAAAGTNIGQAYSCIIDANAPGQAADQDLTGDGIPDLLTVGTGTNGIPAGLWLADGQAGSNGFDGTVTTTVTDIARIGPQDIGPSTWTGTKVITGQFDDLNGPGFNDVEAYEPGTQDVEVLTGNGNGTIDTSQGLNLTGVLSDTNYTDNQSGTLDYPLQLVNAYHVSCDQPTCPQYADQIGLFNDPQAGAYLAYFQNDNSDNSFDTNNGNNGLPWELTNTTPDGTMDWTDWTITTADATPSQATGTNMWLWNQTTGALYLWRLAGLTSETPGGFNTSTFTTTNPTATLTYTQTELSTGWNQGTTLNTFQATEVNGDPGLITVNSTGQVQSYEYNGTLIQANATQQLLTGDHNYLLDQGNSGTAVGTAPDSPGTGDTEQDLAAPANNTGTTWNTSDDVYSPDVAFNGSSTSYLASSGATFNPDSSFTISAWVNPTALGGTVFSQDGTDDSSIEVSSTTSGQWSMSVNTGDTTTGTYVTMPGGIAEPGLWTNLTLTYDSAVDLLDLYANGAPVGSLYDATPPSTVGPFVLGASQTDGSYDSFLTGQLADVQVWDSLTIQPSYTPEPAAFQGAAAVVPADDGGLTTGGLSVFAITTGSGLETTDQSAPGSTSGNWTNLGGDIQGTPVIVPNDDGGLTTGGFSAFAIGPSGLGTAWQSAAGSTWSGWANLGGSLLQGTSPVVMPVSAGGLSSGGFTAFAISSSGELATAWQSASGSTWTDWTDLGGDFQGTPAIVPVNYGGLTSGGLAAFAIGPSGLETAWQSAPGSTWTGWTDLGGSLLQGTTPVVVPVDDGGLTSGGFSAFAISSTGELATDWQSAPGSGWSGWADLGGDFQGTPAIVPVDDGGLTSGGFEAFAISTNGQLETASQGAPGSGWGGWTSLAGDFSGTPVVVPITGSGVTSGFEVFAITTGGQLETAWQTTPSSAWSSWVSLG
jgi:hypothetical protein